MKKLSNARLLFGHDLLEVLTAKPTPAFSNDTLDFLCLLSDAGLKFCKSNPDYSEYSSFFFWIRLNNLLNIHKKYPSFLFGRGLSFHIAPANVPANLLYTLVFGLLAGNPSIIRGSERIEEQLKPIFKLINKIIGECTFSQLPLFSCISYPRDQDLNAYLSSLANVRLIWGGDDTVSYFKSLSTLNTCVDITFPSKTSYTYIDKDLFDKLDTKAKLSCFQRLASDIELYSQNACSSPIALVIKSSSSYHSNSFFSQLSCELQKLAINKKKNSVDSFYSASDASISLIEPPLGVHRSPYLNIFFYKHEQINEIIALKRPSNSLLYACYVRKFSDFNPPLTAQTITLLPHSAESALNLYYEIECSSINRIVPAGRAIDMHLLWDGYDIIAMSTKHLTFK